VTWSNPRTRTVLLVEPDARERDCVVGILGQGAQVIAARTGQEAIDQLSKRDASLVLLMSSLPDMSVLDLCRRVREGATPPMVFIGGFDTETEVLASYAAGADGYITKPISLRELDARIQAALRRAPAAIPYDDAAITVGDITLSPGSHEVWVRGRAVQLPLREFELLSVLMARPGKIWNRGALMRRLWAETPPSGTKSLDVHIGRIRARIEHDPARPTRIVTVRGVGYQYAAPVAATAD